MPQTLTLKSLRGERNQYSPIVSINVLSLPLWAAEARGGCAIWKNRKRFCASAWRNHFKTKNEAEAARPKSRHRKPAHLSHCVAEIQRERRPCSAAPGASKSLSTASRKLRKFLRCFAKSDFSPRGQGTIATIAEFVPQCSADSRSLRFSCLDVRSDLQEAQENGNDRSIFTWCSLPAQRAF